ncbi:hypothetical protein F5Y18DRAFT_384195 [Xylariaceae sp. FL1019]|nr:hypothetical protein F5Y18DRAFT_384195 [Xylariaceae sp. FL1019]
MPTAHGIGWPVISTMADTFQGLCYTLSLILLPHLYDCNLSFVPIPSSSIVSTIMSLPLSLGDVLAIVQGAVELYKKIRDAPEDLRRLGEEMKDLKCWLQGVEEMMGKQANSELSKLSPKLTAQARANIKNLKKSTEPIKELFRRYEASQGSLGPWLSDIYFAMGHSRAELEAMGKAVDSAREKLLSQLQLIGMLGINALLTTAGPNQSPTLYATRDQSQNAVGMIFVDPHNLGRSRVAEGYTKLLREWTERTGGRWPVKFAHSAGFFVENRSDLIGVLSTLDLRWPESHNFSQGNKPPVEVPMSALFDSKFFNYPYKAQVRSAMMAQMSRGITKNIFKVDYVLVFTRREYKNLALLRKTLLSLYGTTVVPEGKGMIVNLGHYLGQGKKREILDAKKEEHNNFSRENWLVTISDIKMAIKAFLKQELDWIQPEPGARQS